MRPSLFLAGLFLLATPAMFAQAQDRADSPYTAAFKRADTNGDGHLTGLEQDVFNQLRKQQAQGTDKKNPTFVLDANHDGTVSHKERQDYRDQRRAYWKHQREVRRAERLARRQHKATRSHHTTTRSRAF